MALGGQETSVYYPSDAQTFTEQVSILDQAQEIVAQYDLKPESKLASRVYDDINDVLDAAMAEPQVVSVPSFTLTEAQKRELQELALMEQVFCEALGIDRLDKLNFNPVKERWNFEKLMANTDDPVKAKSDFRAYQKWQINTALRERHGAAKSAINYFQDEQGTLYSDLFPNEPFKTKIERGIAAQVRGGSKELAREWAEYIGWCAVTDELKNPATPAHTKKLVISGPGIVEGTSSPDNFLDVYEALDDPLTGKRYIHMTRNAMELDYNAYTQIVLNNFDPNYFANYPEDYPLDAWFLGHALNINPKQDGRTTDEIIEQSFGRRKNALSEATMLHILAATEPQIDLLIDAITAESFNPKDIALNVNATLNKSDLVKHKLSTAAQTVWTSTSITSDMYVQNGESFAMMHMFQNAYEESQWLGKQKVTGIDAACGKSAGFDIGSVTTVSSMGFESETSLSGFTFYGGSTVLEGDGLLNRALKSSEKTKLCCTCPKCKNKVEAIIENRTITCLSCGASAPWKK